MQPIYNMSPDFVKDFDVLDKHPAGRVTGTTPGRTGTASHPAFYGLVFYGFRVMQRGSIDSLTS